MNKIVITEQMQSDYEKIVRDIVTVMMPRDVSKNEIRIHVRDYANALHYYAEVPKRHRGKLIGRGGVMCQNLRQVITAIGKTRDNVNIMFHIYDEDEGLK